MNNRQKLKFFINFKTFQNLTTQLELKNFVQKMAYALNLIFLIKKLLKKLFFLKKKFR
jgi:hypothetical protein